MTKKRIVFCTLGSLGDVYPILALAQEMKRRAAIPGGRSVGASVSQSP